jgi:hypothetical protein
MLNKIYEKIFEKREKTKKYKKEHAQHMEKFLTKEDELSFFSAIKADEARELARERAEEAEKKANGAAYLLALAEYENRAVKEALNFAENNTMAAKAAKDLTLGGSKRKPKHYKRKPKTRRKKYKKYKKHC